MKAHLATIFGIPALLLFVLTGTTLAQDAPLSPDDPLPHALYLPLAAAPIRGSTFIELGAPDDLAVVGEPYTSTVPVNQYLDAYWVKGFQLAADSQFGVSSPAISAEGVVTWLPRAGDVGVHHYRLTALINDGSTLDRAIVLEVAPRTPLIAATVGSEGGTLADPGGDYQVIIPANAVAEDAGGVQVEVSAVKRADGRAVVTRALMGLDPAATATYTEPLFSVQTEQPTLVQQDAQAPATCTELPFITAFNPAPQTKGGYVDWADPRPWESYLPDAPQNMPFVLPTGARVETSTYAATDGGGLTELRGTCKSNCLGQQPVLFVHGYAQWGKLGGGIDNWGCGFKYIEGLGGLPYEFRWRGNTRFEEVAYYLGQAIAQVTELTGRKPLLVGHSMGGILISTYLAGLAEMPDASARKLVQVGYDSAAVRGARHSAAAARVVTIGSPLSGISSAGEAPLNGLPQGRDAHLTGKSMLVCDDLTCGQSGTRTTRNTYPGWYTTQQKVDDFRAMFGIPLEAPGALIHRLFDAWRGTTVTNTIPSNIHFDVLVSAWYLFGTPNWSDAEWGDGLIAVTGMQAVPGHLVGETAGGVHYNFIRTLGRTLTPAEKAQAKIPPNLDYTFMMTVTQNPSLFGYPHGRYFNEIANWWWWVWYGGAANPNAAAQDYPLGGTVQFSGISFDHALKPVLARNFALASQEAPVFTTTVPAAVVISGTLVAPGAPGQQTQPLRSEPILVVVSIHGRYQGAVQVATDASGSWRLDLGTALAPYGITTTDGLEVVVRMGNDTLHDAETVVLDAAQLDTAKDVGVFALPAR